MPVPRERRLAGCRIEWENQVPAGTLRIRQSGRDGGKLSDSRYQASMHDRIPETLGKHMQTESQGYTVGEFTAILFDWQRGVRGASETSYPKVYAELKRIARYQLGRRSGVETLCATELVHEVYLKLAGQSQVCWRDSSHFFAVVSTAIRHMLIDRARRKYSLKGGGEWLRVTFDEACASEPGSLELLLALDQALTQLATLSERLARVVEYRFFGGLKETEVAALLGIDERTVRRDWRKAKAFLAAKVAPSRVLRQKRKS